ncbi:PTS beta-glucoside transporter subunit IIB [Listeria monocytogenes]|nr:PTS beta-glucoside transporter subunit IIB [Listeria monocytogenes]
MLDLVLFHRSSYRKLPCRLHLLEFSQQLVHQLFFSGNALVVLKVQHLHRQLSYLLQQWSTLQFHKFLRVLLLLYAFLLLKGLLTSLPHILKQYFSS